MEFKAATDALFARITAQDLATELGVSQNAVARARLEQATRDYRPPPVGWEQALLRVAMRRVAELNSLMLEFDRGEAHQ